MIKIIWHEYSNVIGVVEPIGSSLPLILILDDDYRGINPFYSYPLETLKMFGWIEIGTL